MPTAPPPQVPSSAVLAATTTVGVLCGAALWFGSEAPQGPRAAAATALAVLCVSTLGPIAFKANPKAVLASLAVTVGAALVLVATGAPGAALAMACVPFSVALAQPVVGRPEGWLLAAGLGLAAVMVLQWQDVAFAALEPGVLGPAGATTILGLYLLLAGVVALRPGLAVPDPEVTSPQPPPTLTIATPLPVMARDQWSVSDPELLEADKLESLGLLAGGIAHDFNNLLTSILGNASVALSDLEQDGLARGPVTEIETAARTARELVAQLLAYAGKGQLSTQAVDLARLVEEMAGLLERVVSPNTRLVLDLSPDVVLVEGDPSQLRQLVMNLLTNASDALGGAEGSVLVRVALDDLSSLDLSEGIIGEGLPTGEYAVLEVRDTGCGMDADTRRRIFEPYFTTKVTGRGLGLAALLGIVRNHHGAIAVESAPGEGTTFSLWLPWAEALDAEEDGPTEQQSVFTEVLERHGTVLLAEDEEMVRRVSTRMLSRLGYDVITAQNGTEALAAFEAHADELTLILLDVQMPELDGREVLAHISRRRPEARVVMMTGFSEHILSDLPRPPNALLRKPFSMRDLVRALDEAVEAVPGPPTLHDE